MSKKINVFLSLILLTGCQFVPQTQTPKSEQQNQTITVDVAIAKRAVLQQAIQYTGTTEPATIVLLRPRVEGKLISLNVDEGDLVTKGEIIAELDDSLLLTEVKQQQAELSALIAELDQAKTAVRETQTLVAQNQAQLRQAEIENERTQMLLEEGAIAKQQAEITETSFKTTLESLKAAQEQVNNRQQAVIAAQKRITAQEAIVANAQERQSYSKIISPLTGIVVERLSEPGNLVQQGAEILRIGDFSDMKIMVQVSELDISKIRIGQSVEVKLDAFPQEKLTGVVKRISPLADNTARLIPVEVKIANIGGKISSGLLARVNFVVQKKEQVIIPETAIKQGTVFIIDSQTPEPTVIAKTVEVGYAQNGQVEILSGLASGEQYVVKSSSELKNGDTVNISVISETSSLK